MPPGPALTLPPAETDRFMELWRDSNERVAREFLGDRSGRLFAPARVSGATTSEQRLEPERLEELLEVMDLPEAAREPVRRIAAREAARE